MSIKRLIQVVVFFIIGIIMLNITAYSLVDDRNSYTRISMHEMKEAEEIPYVFVGASHTYRGIDPEIIETYVKGPAFNAGTSSQRPEDGYYLLKYILERHHVDTVVYDVWYSGFQNYSNDSTIRTHIILDYMDFGLTKLEYASSVLGNAAYAFTPLSDIARYKDSWKDVHFLLSNLRMHLFDEEYLSYDYKNAVYPTEWYMRNGFVYSTEVYQGGNYGQLPWDSDDLYPEQVNYLKKIIKLCKSYDCDLIFVSVPVYSSYIQREPHYEEVYNFFSNISKENNIPYYDFNMSSLDDIGLVKSDFKDEVHLNGRGAEKFSNYLGELLAEIE